jgi:hypothetical protein
MKVTVQFARFISIIFCFSIVMIACKKNEPTSNPPNNPPNGNNNNGGTATADTVSNHLQFFSANKIPGQIPKGPTGGSMKISFRDTLYLVDQVKIPIKFLHLDTTQNVTGVFIQVAGLLGGSFSATDYYDVPEIQAIDSASDTVSIILIGIDPANLKLPLDFNITITPHNSSGQPIVQVTRPVKIVEHKTDPTGQQGSCGVVLPSSKYWDWNCSYIISKTPGKDFDFFDDPNKVFLSNGQMIAGSCCAGTSVYGICPRERKPNRSLHFATPYQIFEERLIFYDAGNFFRLTSEDAPIPLPDKSDFCAGGEGVIKENINNTTYGGDYSVHPATLPPDLQSLFHDSLGLSLLQTSSSGGGYGNGGGIIHELDCTAGIMVLIGVDPEGFGQHLYKIYIARFVDDIKWYSM